MAINDRVKLIMEQEELSSGEFADRTGIQQSTLSHFINGRNKASLDVIMKIHQAFSDVNIEWLLYGQGSMRTQKTHGNGISVNNNGYQVGLKNNDIDMAEQVSGISLDSLGAIAPILAKQSQGGATSEPIKPPRKITEIRVFFDDNTYETFVAK